MKHSVVRTSCKYLYKNMCKEVSLKDSYKFLVFLLKLCCHVLRRKTRNFSLEENNIKTSFFKFMFHHHFIAEILMQQN